MREDRGSKIKVFISYSHDSGSHKSRVLDLSNELRSKGVDCMIDRYDPHPAEGWPMWMEHGLRESDFILMVCTRTYFRRFIGEEEPEKGKGVRWEALLVRNFIYHDQSRNKRFIPVVFSGEELQFVPEVLSGVTSYDLSDAARKEALYRRLTEQPEVVKPEVGEVDRVGEQAADGRVTVTEVDIDRLPVPGRFFVGRDMEMARLNRVWFERTKRLAALIAWGGVGKSALVHHWVQALMENDSHGAEEVFAWSFYSQVSSEGKQTSADLFFKVALKRFGDADPEAGSDVDKGRRLAGLVGQKRVLMILDGLEPLQWPENDRAGQAGKLKDRGMAAMLKALAIQNKGMCLITSRETITDLHGYRGVDEWKLDRLAEDAGAELLKEMGVRGRLAELKKAVQEFGGHALALNLLGQFVNEALDGDIRQRDRFPDLLEEHGLGRHARRVMSAYDNWLEPDGPERQILRIMGLFDRPAELEAVEALKQEPFIPGVTDNVAGLDELGWNRAITRLANLNLLAKENDRGEKKLDCHPLVREHFNDVLENENRDGKKEAHLRLYHYYRDKPEKKLPDTLEEMEPLLAAVAHGCMAGKHQEVVVEVFWKRILRCDDFYIFKQLGAFGSALTALWYFFRRPWSQPEEGLTEPDKAVVLSWSAFGLRALGRLREAASPMEAGLSKSAKQSDWKGASQDAGNLSELHLTLGHVKEAMVYGEAAVAHADKSEEHSQMEIARIQFSDALHQAGQFYNADLLFREAEEMQRKRKPKYNYLYSGNGFRYCDLLLSQAQTAEEMEAVVKRAEHGLKISTRNNWILDIALDHLTLGRARMRRDYPGPVAPTLLEQAVEGLRKYGSQQHLPRGLLSRAACYRKLNQLQRAQTDLNETLEIAEAGEMKLHLIDYHLESARLCIVMNNEKQKHFHLQNAEELIKETGYFRREKELKELKMSEP